MLVVLIVMIIISSIKLSVGRVVVGAARPMRPCGGGGRRGWKGGPCRIGGRMGTRGDFRKHRGDFRKHRRDFRKHPFGLRGGSWAVGHGRAAESCYDWKSIDFQLKSLRNMGIWSARMVGRAGRQGARWSIRSLYD